MYLVGTWYLFGSVVKEICASLDSNEFSRSIAGSYLLPSGYQRTCFGDLMPTLVFASSKGGVGKTTSALTLASVISHLGVSTTLIDADPNTPLALWAKRFPANVPANLTIQAAFRTDVAEFIDSAKDTYVIVDLEGSRNEEVSVAIGRADLVLIPMKGNQLDADEAVNVIKVIRKQETIFRRKIPFTVFITQNSHVIVDRGMKEICAQFRENDIPMMKRTMYERAAFKVPFRLGGTIYDLTEKETSSPQAAISDAEEFAQEVRDILFGKKIVADAETEEVSENV